MQRAFVDTVLCLAMAAGLSGCMLKGAHDLEAVQPAVYPLDLSDINTYVLGTGLLSITRAEGGYEFTEWLRPEKKGDLFKLFHTVDRKGWLYQAARQRGGETTYEYAYLEKRADRLTAMWDIKRGIVGSSRELNRVLPDKYLLTKSAGETYAVLNQLVRANALGDPLEFLAPEAAVAVATSEIGRDRGNLKWYLHRAVAWHARGEHAKAISDLTLVVNSSQEQRTEALLLRGIAHRSAGSHDLAIADLTAVIAREREAAAKKDLRDRDASTCLKDALYARALTWQQKGDHDRAVAGYDETILHDDKANDAYFRRGKIRQSKGDLVGAIADYGEALRVLPPMRRRNWH